MAEALPHLADSLDLAGFLNTMAVLGYRARSLSVRAGVLDPRVMPCLFVPKEGAACVLLSSARHELSIYDGDESKVFVTSEFAKIGTAYVFSKIDHEEARRDARRTGWFAMVGSRFRSMAFQVLGLTLAINVLALAMPLFVMAVYDRVIATGSISTLSYLAIGVIIALICDQVLRALRSRILSFVAARLDFIVSTAVFQKILSLPLAFIERSTIGAQIARLRDFDNVRDFFTGPMCLVIFEIPFVFMFVFVLALIGGPVALVPLGMIVLFTVIGFVFKPMVRARVAQSAHAASRRQEMMSQLVGGLHTIKYCAAESAWQERYREASADAALASFKLSRLTASIGDLSQVLMVAAGMATIVVGVLRVFDHAMTVGALIASMILVWRILAPIQLAFVTISRLAQIQSSVKQIDNLMALRTERDPGLIVDPIRKVSGQVTFSRVSMRYAPDAEPALIGVEFDVSHGDVCAIIGANGAGKSTALKLLLGLYPMQAGTILLDHRDIRQMDPVELRHLIGYQPQVGEFYYGTLAQNLRLCQPDATDEDLAHATQMVGVYDTILDLPEGFETRIGDGRTGHLSTSFRQQLSLARALVKRPPVILLDEPGSGLDFSGDRALVTAIERLKGVTTVLLVTHRPSHLALADKILWLDRGSVRAFGPASQIKPLLPEDL